MQATQASTAVTHGAHEEAFYADPHFWVALSFVLFMVVFVRKVLPLINQALDKRAEGIRDELDQATRLREEAEELLKTYKLQQREMQKQAKEIIENATRDAAAIRANAAEELKATLARRRQQAEDNIKRAQTDAHALIKREIVDLAVVKAKTVVAAQLQDAKEDPAIQRALAEIERQIH
jgi:F-type H+-transporting ATPase subunit b